MKFGEIIYSFLANLLSSLPETYSINKFRGKIIGPFLKNCGKNFIFSAGFIIKKPHFISVGDNCAINVRLFMSPSKDCPIIIGDNVLIGPNCVFRSASHKFDRLDIPISQQGHEGGPIIIEDDCWLGACVIVLPNVTIGTGSVIGAGSVVTKSIPPYSVAFGVPARVVRSRKNNNINSKDL